MTEPSTRPRTRSLLPVVRNQLAAALGLACHQERVATRLLDLTLGLVLALGRHTVTRVLVTIGDGERDWSAAYRLFQRPRVDLEVLRQSLLRQLVGGWSRRSPVRVVLDATHLPRSSGKLVGVGWAKAPRTPPWRSGIHRTQRWFGLSVLLPRSARGESRSVPLRFTPAPSPKAKAWVGHPPLTEWAAGLEALQWLRRSLDTIGQTHRRILAIADGSDSVAPLWRALPAHVTLLARCAKNRALFHLAPVPDEPARGRRRKYGGQGPSPLAQLTALPRRAWETVTVIVRNREIPLKVSVTGPWLVKLAPDQPLYLLVVGGIQHLRRGTMVRRDPTYWLVSAVPDRTGAWVLPYPVADLLGWAWQRWEVEVMHRELKQGFGLGQQQAWSPVAAATTIQWVVWSYAIVLLAAYQVWGWTSSPLTTSWYHGHRWTVRDALTTLKSECWLEQTTGSPVITANQAAIRPPPPRFATALPASARI